jgi:predicted nucleotidyltransferase
MINTSPILSPMPDRPVDPTTILVIREIQKASRDLGFPVLLVGATARIILLENMFGLNAGRATTDVDFAFALDIWEQFSELKNYLIKNSNCKEAGKIAQRLYMKIGGLETAYKVDLIPFGGIEIKPNTIAWPPDKTFVMNVAGYKDALAASIPVEVLDGVIINVASLPGIAILKIFARAVRVKEDAVGYAFQLLEQFTKGFSGAAGKLKSF